MNKDRWIGLGFCVLCALLWFVVIPQQTEGPEEAFVPRLAVLGMALPALIMLIRRPPTGSPSGFDPAIFLRVALPLALGVLAYAIGMNWLGFYSSSAIFLVIVLLFFGERRPVLVACLPAALLGTVYFVISYCLKFQLPQGLLF